MRVISGSAKGRILTGPKSDRIRPALDKVKQAIFNILWEIQGKTVLDLFAGTGSIGIEAISRGAAHCTFVDLSREALNLVKKNLEKCGLEMYAKIFKFKIPPIPPRIKGEAEEGFALIFVDPPYDNNLVNPTLLEIARENLLAPDGIVVVEHSPREPIKKETGLRLVDQRKYGQTLISFLKR